MRLTPPRQRWLLSNGLWDVRLGTGTGVLKMMASNNRVGSHFECLLCVGSQWTCRENTFNATEHNCFLEIDSDEWMRQLPCSCHLLEVLFFIVFKYTKHFPTHSFEHCARRWRCPIEQNQTWFVPLGRLGVQQIDMKHNHKRKLAAETLWQQQFYIKSIEVVLRLSWE